MLGKGLVKVVDEHLVHDRNFFGLAAHKHGSQAVKILLRDWIELVVVTNRATRGQAHPDFGGRFDAVARIEHLVLFVDGSAFARGDVATVESARDFLVERGVRQ